MARCFWSALRRGAIFEDSAAGAQVWTGDQLLFYHAEGVRVITGGLPSAPQPNGYIALAPHESLPPHFADRQPIYAGEGWRVYAIQPGATDSGESEQP